MRPQLIDVMQDQVRTIYRALTGTDVPEPPSPSASSEAPFEEVTRRFAELETLARADPLLSELVPPFSFTPSLDAFCSQDRIVVELAVPGVERDDLNVELSDGLVVISGLRRAHQSSAHRSFSHAEIPRGPFYRAFRIPMAIEPDPDVSLERGLLRIQLKRTVEQHLRQEGESDSRDTGEHNTEQ